MNNIQITGIAGAYIEHSMVITNFVGIVGNQLKNSLCRVFPDDEEPFLISAPGKPGNKGKFVAALLPEWRFYLKFISIR